MKRTRFSVFLVVFLFVLIFCCGSATAATINVNNSTPNAITNAVDNASAGDTLNLSAGTYNEHDIFIDKDLTITGPVTSGTPTAIIDAQQLGRIFYINLDVTVNLKYLTIQNGKIPEDGGGICNLGTVYVTNSNINNNTADNSFGGGISNEGRTVSVTNSNITGNKATYGGGIFNNGDTVSVIDSNINNNTANACGGGIYNWGALTVSGCDFTSNQAGSGNAIYNFNGDATTRIIHFNRFYDVASGYEIYNFSGSVDAKYNWWGSNSNPAPKIGGTGVDTTVWLVLSVNAKPVFIGKNGSSNITANLWFDSNGAYHNPSAGHIPDGIPITFYSTLGIVNTPVTTSNGSVTTTLTPSNTDGVATVYAILNDQFAQTSIIIDATTPTVTSIDPISNAVINNTSKVVKITFSETVQKGTAFNNITITQNGTPIPITTALNGNVLTLTKTGNYTDGIYTITIPANALMDSAGNNINTYTSKFTIDTIPPVVSTSNPTNGKTGVKRNQTITITFNENILAGSNYSKITLKSSTGKTITITKSISGKVLTIKHSALLSAKTKYTLTLYSGSIKDQAGNPIATKTITFTTGST